VSTEVAAEFHPEESKEVSAPARDAIRDLALAVSQLEEQVDCPLIHYFAHGLYGRRIFMQAGICVVSRVHKHQHLTVVLYGRAIVRDAFGNEKLIEGPDVFVTEPGTQRALLIDTDSEWMTIHHVDTTEERSGDEMKEFLTFKTFAEYEDYLAALPSPE
jgi:quercetin dioxygenase-like cupin family protein